MPFLSLSVSTQKRFSCLALLSLAMLAVTKLNGQISFSSQQSSDCINDRIIASIDKKYNALNDRIDRQLPKTLSRFEKQEDKLQKKIGEKDSAAAALLASSQKQYQQLRQLLENPLQGKRIAHYIPELDSLQTASKFLEQSGVFDKNKIGEVVHLSEDLQKLEGNLYAAEQVESFLKQRKAVLTTQLERLGMASELSRYKKQFYYFRQQMEEYKNVFHDQKKLEEKVLTTLHALPAFQQFMQKNSYLSQLFPVSNVAGPVDPMNTIPGLQTRASTQSLLQERLGTTTLPSPNGAAGSAGNPLDQPMQAAQQQLNVLKDKVNKLGGNSETEMPDFKPNTQKTKTFLQRLEPGIVIQSGGSSKWLPAITDIGLSLGYKLSDKSSFGIKIAYKIGFGQPVKNIHFSSEGVNMGAFLDIKAKGSWWISGGAEYDYLQSFKSLQEMHADINVWEKSVLLGISKKVKTGKYRSNVQMLYDFLWKQQVPAAQPFKFRVGLGL